MTWICRFAQYVIAKGENIVRRGAVPSPEASTYRVAYLTGYESLVITGEIGQHRGKWIYIAGALTTPEWTQTASDRSFVKPAESRASMTSPSTI